MAVPEAGCAHRASDKARETLALQKHEEPCPLSQNSVQAAPIGRGTLWEGRLLLSSSSLSLAQCVCCLELHFGAEARVDQFFWELLLQFSATGSFPSLQNKSVQEHKAVSPQDFREVISTLAGGLSSPPELLPTSRHACLVCSRRHTC